MIDVQIRNGSETRLMIAKQGKSLRQFAISIGISPAYLSQVLNNKRKPSPFVAGKISKGLKCQITDIFLIKMSVDNGQQR